jgi:hypothetical protein
MKKVTIASKPKKAMKEPVDADQWVEAANASEPGEAMKRFTVDIPVSLHQRIKYTCALEGLKMTEVFRELLAERFPDRKRGE